jgi:Double zinc ribbon
MQCPACGADNREGSNFCRLCSTPLTAEASRPDSGYIPSVPPPDQRGPKPYFPPQNFQQAPPPLAPRPVRQVVPLRLCPRCNSASVIKGSIPLWAILVAVIGAPFTCLLSLLFLLVKEPHRCLGCGLAFK